MVVVVDVVVVVVDVVVLVVDVVVDVLDVELLLDVGVVVVVGLGLVRFGSMRIRWQRTEPGEAGPHTRVCVVAALLDPCEPAAGGPDRTIDAMRLRTPAIVTVPTTSGDRRPLPDLLIRAPSPVT